ncbi:hypothetical protein AAEU29_11260 [Pseudoalteromonas sp. SSM20]|uniref:hypothetical protein n=1 Tax=Pseudoalteromonas sp. SSM20 TaxID=3139394 RepID=UPI003BAB0809
MKIIKVIGILILFVIVFNRLASVILQKENADSQNEQKQVDEFNISEMISSSRTIVLPDGGGEIDSFKVDVDVWSIKVDDYDDVLDTNFEKYNMSLCQNAFSMFLKFKANEQFPDENLTETLLSENSGCGGYSDIYIKDEKIVLSVLEDIKNIFYNHTYFDKEISRFKAAALKCVNSDEGGEGYFCEEIKRFPIHALEPLYDYDGDNEIPLDQFTRCFDDALALSDDSNKVEAREAAKLKCKAAW